VVCAYTDTGSNGKDVFLDEGNRFELTFANFTELPRLQSLRVAGSQGCGDGRCVPTGHQQAFLSAVLD
jgi:hypothetical protein